MEMEQIYCDGLPSTLSTNKPWLVAHNLDDNRIVNFYTTIDEQPSNYLCRFLELQQLKGVHIRGFCHGWMILSNPPHNVMWYLLNPVTSNLIRLPPLAGDLDHEIRDCCLSSPPGDPAGSILLFKRYGKPNFVFCRLDRKRKRSRWTEMSYAKQLKRLMGGEEGGDLDFLTCCNGKVYALLYDTSSVVQIDIKFVKNKEVVISILPFQNYPTPYFHSLPDFYVLKGSGTELFAITGRCGASAFVYLFKLDLTTTHDDTTSSTWEEIHDLKDAVFFVDLNELQPVSYIPTVTSPGLGGYVHIRGECRIIINSFHVKDRTLSALPMPCLRKAFQVSLWEYYRGLGAGNDKEIKCTDDYKHEEHEEEKENDDDHIVVPMRSSSNTEEDDESRLLDVPFHVLEMITEHCVGIEYMNFRATCKRCHLAAPPIHWRNKTSLRKLQKYLLVSPWLMVVENNGGIMNFTDPVSGDKYFMKLRLPAALSLNYDELNSISCSRFGWLLFYTSSSNLGFDHHQLVFFNPFTNDVRKLPPTLPHYLHNLCFSAPPTSTNCMVVGFLTKGHAAYILRYHGNQEEQLLWRRFDVDYGGSSFRFPTFHGRDLYALCNKGQLVVFKDMSEGMFSQPEVVTDKPPKCWLLLPQYFLMERGQYLLLLIGGKFGGDPKLFQFNDSTKEWSQIESLGTDVIFIGGATCVCKEAKATPKMQNKIYFPRLKDEKLIFYSLETSKYHTFDGKLAATDEEAYYKYGCLNFRSTKHLSLNAWIEPSWY